jgi:hypothetical protein
VGTSTARANFTSGARTSPFQVEGTSLNDSALSILRNSNDTGQSGIYLAKSRSTTVGDATPNIVADGDSLGSIFFQGADNTNFVSSASITAQVDGTPGSNDMPGRIVLSTTSDGASSPTERMRIDSNGTVSLSNSATGVALTAGGAIISTTVGGIDGRLQAGYSGAVGIGAQSNHPISFIQNATERARIDSSGRLLVGTSSAYSDYVGTESGFTGIGGFVRNIGDGVAQFQNWSSSIGLDAVGGTSLFISRCKSGTVGTHTGGALASGNPIGRIVFNTSDGANFRSSAYITAEVDGGVSTADVPGRLVFSTTADGAATPSERMRITSAGTVGATLFWVGSGGYQSNGTQGFTVSITSDTTAPNAANSVVKIGSMPGTSRSINAAGTINASGADYAEYMTKVGDFTIAKGDVCGVTADGQLTNEFANAISFVVKSTNPSYVGGDTWGSGFDDNPEGLEVARQTVDRIAFAGQVPVNVTGATPGQYIVPVAATDGGITGIAKDEADLTLPEYMRAVGKVIATESDGRARIIVKVA